MQHFYMCGRRWCRPLCYSFILNRWSLFFTHFVFKTWTWIHPIYVNTCLYILFPPISFILCCHSEQFVAQTTWFSKRSLHTSSFLIQNVCCTKVSHRERSKGYLLNVWNLFGLKCDMETYIHLAGAVWITGIFRSLTLSKRSIPNWEKKNAGHSSKPKHTDQTNEQ